jgi:hypothetical protein
MPTTITIKITGINPDGTLILDNNNHPHHVVDRDVIVRWQIEGNVIDSITGIKEKSGSENIWSVLPSPTNNQQKIWTGRVNKDAKSCDVYVYSITWYKDGTRYEFDPIISINPSTNLLPLIIYIVLGGLFLIQTFRLRNLRLQKNLK